MLECWRSQITQTIKQSDNQAITKAIKQSSNNFNFQFSIIFNSQPSTVVTRSWKIVEGVLQQYGMAQREGCLLYA
jgi:hypothetical protein